MLYIETQTRKHTHTHTHTYIIYIYILYIYVRSHIDMQIHIQIMWDYTYWFTTACTPGFGFCPEVIQEGCWHCQEPCEAQARCQSQVKKVQVQNRSLNIRMWLFQYYILGKISQCHVVSAVRSSYGICHLCSSWFIFIITCKQVHPTGTLLFAVWGCQRFWGCSAFATMLEDGRR